MTSETEHRRVASSVSSTIAARFAVVVCGLAASIVSARVLGPAGRGQYFAVMTLGALFGQATNLGLTSSNVLLGAQDPGRLRPLLVNSLYVAVFFGLVGVAIVFAWGRLLAARVDLPVSFLLAVCAIGATILFWNLAGSLLMAVERFHTMNVWQLVNGLASLAGVAACALYRAGSPGFVLAAVLAAGSTAVGILCFMIAGNKGTWTFSWELVRRGLGFSSRAYLALVFGYFLQRAGAAVMTVRGHASALGEYSIASQAFDVLLIVPASVSTVLFPFLVRTGEASWPQVRQAARYTVLLMLAACSATAIAAPWVVPLLFGKQYAAAVPVLWALLPAVIAYTVVSVLSQYLVIRDFPWSLVIVWAAGLALAYGAAGALTRGHGATGAAIGQSFGAAFVCAGVLVIIGHRLHPRLLRFPA
jgi:O-antigen/teichoic acid export membrane protein